MEVKILKIGNAQAVLIPKPILAQLGLGGSADLQVRDGVIEIRALRRIPRKDWADDARRLAAGDDWPVWPELGNLQSGSEHLASQTSALGRKRTRARGEQSRASKIFSYQGLFPRNGMPEMATGMS